MTSKWILHCADENTVNGRLIENHVVTSTFRLVDMNDLWLVGRLFYVVFAAANSVCIHCLDKQGAWGIVILLF